ncbi:thioesterase family protein [Sulfidibacter corallicola]|uniref:Medium/long-chain acyl-CoA thioesterase YigI n=2 Tax=Sulfidibacter corallicola TaxID=2818388 RepID=A0A8A4TQX7_SULCO|nr:thioesterase family protein [Sulfidibacter corallicola]QTD51594.1 thioesterase family protein [Sulfidibacter corallicola]
MEQPEVGAVRQFMQQIPFNRLLGMELTTISAERVDIRIPMKDELVGNFLHGILHGGVVTSVLDVAGGCIALMGAYQRMKEQPSKEIVATLSKVGTIDIRVDFLRPGRGQWFTASAIPLRTGNKVAVTRMELHNDQGHLLAVGTGTYLCG